MRQRAAIGIAQHHPPRACRIGRFGNLKRIAGIGLVAIEKMLAIEQRFAAGCHRRRNALADGIEIIVQRRLERHMDLIIPSLSDKADRIALGSKQTGNAGIIRNRTANFLGHAEGRKTRVFGPLFTEELGIHWVRTGIAALDIVNAQPV